MSESESAKPMHDADRRHVLDRVVAEVKRENCYIPPEEIEAVVTEALDAVRSGCFSEWQLQELERRKGNLLADPASGLDWDDVTRRVRAPSMAAVDAR